MFSTPEMAEAVSGRSWVRAMLRVEATLARAQARAGVLPLDAAEEIAALCGQAEFDITEIGRGAASSASPVVPVVDSVIPGGAMILPEYSSGERTSTRLILFCPSVPRISSRYARILSSEPGML
jgi:hypothetical protein